jgi:hypothetical protein
MRVLTYRQEISLLLLLCLSSQHGLCDNNYNQIKKPRIMQLVLVPIGIGISAEKEADEK